MRSAAKYAVLGFMAGCAVSILIALLRLAILPMLGQQAGSALGDEITSVLWPSSLLLMVASDWSPESILILFTAIVINGLMYSIVFLLIRAVSKLVR
jgi:hypothetical protein